MAAMPIARYSIVRSISASARSSPQRTISKARAILSRLADLLRDQASQGQVGGHGFQAADVAAAAATALRVDGDVPDFARQAAVAGHDLAAAHDRGAEAAGGIDQGEVVHAAGLAEAPLAQAKGVGLVQKDRTKAESLLQVAGQETPVEQVQIGRKEHLLPPPVDQARGGQSQGQRGGLSPARGMSRLACLTIASSSDS